MENNKYVIDCTLGVLDYASMVNSLANDYFDEDGTYTPHIGKLNVMRLFYNTCIKEGKQEGLDTIDEIENMEKIIHDEYFVKEFNHAIETDGTIRLDFANAYRDAIDMVNTRKNSFASAIEVFKGAVLGITEKISPVLTEGNLAKLTKIADEVSKGNLSADAIATAYGNSQRFADVTKKG